MRRPVLTFLAGAVTAVVASAQDTVEFKITRAAGQRQMIHARAHLDLDLTIKNIEDAESLLNIKTSRSEDYVEEYLEAEGDGFRSRIHCTDASVDTVEGTRPLQSVKGPMHDKTVTLSRHGGNYSVSSDDFTVPETEAARIGRWQQIDALLPGKPVHKGDSWDAPAGFVTLLFKDIPIQNAQGEIKVTLSDVVPGPNGSQIGVLSLAAHVQADNITGQPGKEMSIKSLSSDLSGTVNIDLTAARPVSCSLSGSLVMKGDVSDERGAKLGAVEGAAQKLFFEINFEPVAPGQ